MMLSSHIVSEKLKALEPLFTIKLIAFNAVVRVQITLLMQLQFYLFIYSSCYGDRMQVISVVVHELLTPLIVSTF